MDIGEYFFAIFVCIVVFGLLILTTKFLTYKSKKILKGNYMQIVESLSLGVNNRLHLIKIDNEFLVIAATNKNVEFLTKVNIKDYEKEEIKNPISGIIDFKTILKNNISGFNFRNHSQKETETESKYEVGQKPKSTDVMQNSEAVFKENLKKIKHITNTINGQRSENEQKKEY